MNNKIKQAVIATNTLKNFQEIEQELFGEVLEESKPSRIEPRRKLAEKHEQRKKRREFDEYN